MSAAVTARLLDAREPDAPALDLARDRFDALREATRDRAASDNSLLDGAAKLAGSMERMIVIQMAAYPESWTEEERREMAEQHLFGERRS